MSDPQAKEPSDPLLRAVAEHWADIMACASKEQRGRLRALVSGAAEPDPAEARAALADELLDVLPPGHPVIRVLRTGVMTGTGTRVTSAAELADSFARLSRLVMPGGDSAWIPPARNGRDGRDKPPDDFGRRVQARLLGLPSLSADSVDASDGPLIRLPRPDGTWQMPAFQFAEAAVPRPIVREINELLDAEGDPWGVTCWWVDPHERLNAAPADLLGTGQDDLLRRAAMAIGEEL